MTKNGFTEFELCFNKYFNESTKKYTLNSIDDFSNEFFENFTRINFRDNPDGYVKIDNKIVVIEESQNFYKDELK